MHFNGINDYVEQRPHFTIYNPQALPFPAIPELWYNPQPFIPYYFPSPSPPYPSFLPHLFCYSDAAATTLQQKHKSKKMRKSSKKNFWCGGIAQLLWTIVAIIALGLLATLIFALLVI